MSISTSKRGAGRTRTYHHGDLRNVLLASARTLAAEQNVEAFSLREVARRAGVSHTAAYNHFTDKASLVEAMVSEAFRALAAEMRETADTANDPLLRLQLAGIAYVRFAHRHRAEFRFMFRPEHCLPGPHSRDGGAALRTAGSEAYDVLVAAVALALRSGAIVGDAETLVLTAWSVVHGLAALLVDGPQRDASLADERVEALARSVTATLVRGLEARPPKGT